jgi:N-acetylglucosaminyldiphosphoundecaprenol N-acetyl-beta-D-mannosaminyltransferase
MECHRDEALRRIYNHAGLSAPDGVPLVWLSHLAGHRGVRRVYGPDLMLSLCERSTSKGYRHFLYGGAEGVAERLRTNLQHRFPGIRIVGSFEPPFRELTLEEDGQVVRLINQGNPDVIWVGLGTPKQERWMAAHLGRLNAPILVGVGAAFDFHAGVKKQAPVWMRRTGLEWFFRLLSEPRRLGRRYLLYNPQFVGLVLLQALGIKHFTEE